MKWNFRLKIGVTILAVFILGSLILPFFTDVNPTAQGTYFKSLPMSWKHPLGTNSLGQDIMWVIIFAVRNSLLLGVSVSLVANIISVIVGLSAGYFGGWVDRVVMTVTDSFITIPTLPILIILSSLIRGSASFVTIGLILVVFGWAWGGRTIRSMALSLREREFINMARFSGMRGSEIIFKEIFPYVYTYGIVGFINTILYVINTEASLAVIGLSNLSVPTLGSALYWALNYNAMFTKQYSWILSPVIATILLFLGLFLTSTGYNDLFAMRRGRS
ncbi:MAG: ABC transporter permease [Chloroflexi bacterium]|nr:ABC transporter permease [Chloroflexota bacterium]